MGIKKPLILILVLLFPASIYFFMTSGKHNMLSLPIYGQKDVTVQVIDGKEVTDTVYHSLPQFSFTNQHGELLSSEDIEGKIVVANFFFTTCPTICPKMTSGLVHVKDKLNDHKQVMFISHTVDPETDTPEALAEYAKKTRAGENWHFVTGEKEDIYRHAIKGFLVAAQEDVMAPGGFLHSELVVLLDKIMSRTQNRPLPQERISITEAVMVAIFLGTSGIFILWYFMNPLSGILGLTALVLYAGVYTPMKRKSPFAVFVGAIPGAVPPLLGYVAATNSLDIYAWVLFGLQFIWQFPHFWAIAWVLHEDYTKAGFRLLPSPGGKDKSSAFQTFIYSFCLIPVGILPLMFKMSGWASAGIIAISGMAIAFIAYRLYQTCTTEAASKLMFATFIYLPVVQILLLIDKL